MEIESFLHLDDLLSPGEKGEKGLQARGGKMETLCPD